MQVAHEPAFWLAAFGLFVILPFSIWWSYRLHKFWMEQPEAQCSIVAGGKIYKIGKLDSMNDVSIEITNGETKVFVDGKEIQPE